MRLPFDQERQFLQVYPEHLGRRIPVIGISTSRQFSELAETLGVEMCIAKPFGLDELLDCVLKLARKN
jgi:hypothetical protein